MDDQEEIVITGIGVITSIGSTLDETWDKLLAGISGARTIRTFDVSGHQHQIGCEVEDFEHLSLIGRPGGRATGLLLPVVEDALYNARLIDREWDDRIAGISVGTTMGEISPYEDAMLGRGISARGGPSVLADHAGEWFSLNGPSWTITNACAAGNMAIARAVEELRLGRADVMIAAGVDAMSWIAFTGFASLRAMAPDVCRPFDLERKGLLLGEGAAALILERKRDAVARGVKPRAIISGYGLSADAHHITQPDPKAAGSIKAMRKALAMAKLDPEQIGYVSAHGTGTPANDRMECVAMAEVFGEEIRTSSIKGHIGHTLGAASAIEAAVCVKALETGILPPTLHLRTKDPSCAVAVIANEPVSVNVDHMMSNAYAFGGINTSIILSRIGSVPLGSVQERGTFV
ncbi:beta-ketoacyl-[acyl-carrier-protein] synthase family protein [Cohnella soli]|uniref:Beta-ketoacyl-[acyl-carrier-protein] synthase family protein n=1 Tax=Cohnella soli TaxID=425005 RepID=A0ABW0I223_9BACL